MKIRYVSISELIPYKNNPRDNDAAVDAVAASIKEFGFKVPIVIDKHKGNKSDTANDTERRMGLRRRPQWHY